MIKNWIIRFAARNLDSLIDFLNGIDKELDSYIAKQDTKANEIGKEIERLRQDQAAVVANVNTAQNLRGGVRGLTQNA